ncbi:MAG: BlaI/MecI/CopY family transcriptional regulator [Bacteroidales bacterium]|nr:BlaI/MecI/CopY family transcriptional regulator [Bacteroidales bacterium]
MKTLTKAEEQIMQILWKLKEATVKEVVDSFEDSPPAYTTVATVLKVLEKKEFVSHKPLGNTYQFYAILSKKEYTRQQFSSLLTNYFSGSFPKMATFFAKENNLNISELEEMIKMAENELQKEKSHE